MSGGGPLRPQFQRLGRNGGNAASLAPLSLLPPGLLTRGFFTGPLPGEKCGLVEGPIGSAQAGGLRVASAEMKASQPLRRLCERSEAIQKTLAEGHQPETLDCVAALAMTL